MAGPRNTLVTLLTPLLPAGWKIVRTEEALDKAVKPVVILKQSRIQKSEVAPLGWHEIFFTVTVLSPLENRTRAEDQLDTLVNTTIHAIDECESLLWTSAEKVLVSEKYIGYDINLSLVSKKE
jgi:hypothetical protein